MQNVKYIIITTLFAFFLSCNYVRDDGSAHYKFKGVTNKEFIDASEKYKNNNSQFNLYSDRGTHIIELKNEYDSINYNYKVRFYVAENSVGFQCLVSTRFLKDSPAQLSVLGITEHNTSGEAYSTRMEKLSKERKKEVLAIFEEKVLKGLKEQIAIDEKK